MSRVRVLLAATVFCGALNAHQTSARAQGATAESVTLAVESDVASSIIAELERSENLLCPRCVGPVLGLLGDDRYEVRVAAAWWIAKRPQRRQAASNAVAAVASNDSDTVRNAADVLGALGHPDAVAGLSAAVQRGGLSAEARVHAARALGAIGHPDANPALTAAMQDASPELRYEAIASWIQIRGQTDAAPVVGLVDDAEPMVRRKAAAAIGVLRDEVGRVALQSAVGHDEDAATRRNAAWALGRIGDGRSRDVLRAATDDPSGLVRVTARVALRYLR
jgi:HEAT repeat protein